MKKLILILLCNLVLIFPALAADINPLPMDQAFKFNVQQTNTDSIILNWNIKPKYYLYKQRLSFKVLEPKHITLGHVFLPQGTLKTDKFFGQQEVYEQPLNISIPLLNPNHDKLKLLVGYQGCSSEGFCYPPQLKLVDINPNPMFGSGIKIQDYTSPSVTQVANNDLQSAPISSQQKAESILANSNIAFALLLFFGFGLLLAFTPCVLPMIPILSGIIAGHGKNLHTKKAFMLSLVYVLSMSITFAIAGLIIGLLGANVQAAMQMPWVIILFSFLFILLALSLFGFYELQLPHKLQNKITQLSNKQHSGSYLGVAIMGFLATLIVSPCVSAPLVGALAYIGRSGNAFLGGMALFMMGLGMGVPLLIIGTSLGKWLPKSGAWMNNVKGFFGVLMLAMAIWLVSRIIPDTISLILWGILAIGCAIYLGALQPTTNSKLQKFSQSIGFALLIYGSTLLIGATMGNTNPLQPLQLNIAANQNQQHPKLVFKKVKNFQELQRELNLAKLQRKPVMLDFYADWCTACKEMEATTFANPKVKQALNQFILLQVDVTTNDSADKQLEKHYNIIAPPSIIFFGPDGNELKNHRIVGETGPKEFLQQIPNIK